MLVEATTRVLSLSSLLLLMALTSLDLCDAVNVAENEDTYSSLSSFLRKERKLTASTSYSDTFPSRYEITDMLQLSQDIFYVNGNYIDTRLVKDEKWDFQLWVESDKFGTEAMIVQSDNQTVVTFRGTEVASNDYLTNFKTKLISSGLEEAPSDVKVHSGFHDALIDNDYLKVRGNCLIVCESFSEGRNSVGVRLEQEVNSLIDGQNSELYVTGHSLGGAMAQYFGAWMASKYPEMKVKVITSGQPKVGNGAFKSFTEDLSNLAVWRVVYDSDMIARGYFLKGTSSYVHAGHLLQVDEGDKTTAYYRQVGDRDVYEGVPDSWNLRLDLEHHSNYHYLNIINFKVHIDKYWPSSFKMKDPSKGIDPPKCKWWEFWCWLFF